MKYKKIINIFLIILPILDLVTALTTRLYPLPLSLGVIIKGIFLIYLIKYLIFNNHSKYKKICNIYLLLLLIYEILYFGIKMSSLTWGTFMLEIIGQFKFLFFPISLISILCVYNQYNFSKNDLLKILTINILSFLLLLLIPLITNTGFQTYNYTNTLKGTIGWFYSANEISIILILLFPFIYKFNGKMNNFLFYLLNLIILLVISTIGTKSSFIGIIIVSFIMFIITLIKELKNKSKLKIINSIIIFVMSIIILTNNKIINNFSTINNVQNNENIKVEEVLTEEEQETLKENLKGNFFYDLYNQYGKALLSDRDIYFQDSLYEYTNRYNIKTFLFGLGLTNESGYKKLIEIDTIDLYFYYGFFAVVIHILPILYIVYLFFKNKKTTYMFLNILMIFLGYSISTICGHILMAPAVSIYLVIHYCLFFNECKMLKQDKINKGKVTIYALHLNYGGVEKNICTKANILSKIYNVEIISLYKLTDKPVFKLNKKVKVKYLTNNIKPNREEFKKALKEKNIIKIVKEGLYAIKVLYLKDTLITKSMIDCNSEIIISTRIDFTKKLINNNEYNNIKIAEEHIYHNNDKKYLNDLSKILKNIDYLMPSSNYLTNYYKELNTKYSYKILTNNMPIESDNSISNLKNKNIISVGRLDKVKGYNDLINIFSKIDNKEWTLNIVGDGPEYDNLNNQIRDLGLENNVKLLGFKNTDELNKLYKESSIYIMTSLEESFGLVLLEAASHGLPIISYSSALGAKEILKDGNGILIDDRNESEMINNLKDLVNDIKLRKEYQKKSLKISVDYKYENIEKENIEFYKNIKNINIYNNLYIGTKKECYKLVETKLKNKEKTFIVTANPETFMLSEKDLDINNIIYNKDHLIVPDGIAIVKTANYLGYNIKERITGVDLAEYLLELANKNKYKVYLFGASSEVMEKLENVIESKYPNIKLVGSTNGYVKDKDTVMEYIKTTKPDIIMLALGIPLQEKLIYKHINDFKKGIFIGVGGSFDVLSGSKKRAPKLFIKLNLEWFYRIMYEPKRISRFIKYNLRFMIKIFKEKWNK